jgi:signal transduction histidine kinase
MTPPVAGRSPVTRSLAAALVALAAAATLTSVIEFALYPSSAAGPVWALDLFTAAGLVYVAAGLVAWWRRPSNWLGAIMVAGGLSWLAVALANTGPGVLVAVGIVLARLPLAVLVHLLLAFPSGQLRTRAARWTAAAGYLVAVGLQVPQYLFAPAASPGGALAATASPALASAGTWVQDCAGIATMAVTALILAGRVRQAARPQRRVLLPLDLYGIIALLLIPLLPNVIQPLTGLSPDITVAVQVVVLGLVPVAFAAGVLRGGFARTGEIQELGAWLGADAGGRLPVEEALARALGDESVQLAYWMPVRLAYIGADGSPLPLPPAGSGRAAAEISTGGRRIGAIIYDATMIADPELVLAAGRVVAIAVDRQRLTAELLASQAALRESRARLVEAADAERRRIARNLHDGLQTKLVLLALEAQQLAGHPGASPAAAGAATALRERIDAAAAELRELVHAVMPAALIERGLAAAAEDLADRMPVPTRVEIGVDGVLPDSVSATAYFVLAEGLANAVKHARAAKLEVRIARDQDRLVVEVRDDGVGGAASGDGGLGLRSLADRVNALDGRLLVDSPAGQGTNLRAELPCGS